MRRLYDLTVRYRNGDLQTVATHLDLDDNEAEEKLRDLLFDACRRNNDRPELVGDYLLQVRDHGDSYGEVMTYVTTEES